MKIDVFYREESEVKPGQEWEDTLAMLDFVQADTVAHVSGVVRTRVNDVFNPSPGMKLPVQYSLEERIPPEGWLTCIRLIRLSNGEHAYTVYARRVPEE